MSSYTTVSQDYQPIVSVRTGEVWVYEALMRLESPGTQERIYPPQFLERIEQDGTIVTLGIQGIQMARQWQRDNHERVSINISRQQMLDPRILETLSQGEVIAAVELTEQLVMGEVAEKFADEVSQLGTLVMLDDFGTGQANFEALSRIGQVSVLKIDRSVVQSSGTRLTAVLDTIVFLARKLKDVVVVAEGIETQDQARQLIEAGVDYLQGWWVGEERQTPLTDEEKQSLRNRVSEAARR